MKVYPQPNAALTVNADGTLRPTNWQVDCEGGPMPKHDELVAAVIQWFADHAKAPSAIASDVTH